VCSYNKASKITQEVVEVACLILLNAENAARHASALALEAKQEAFSLATTIQTKIQELREESNALQKSIKIEEEKLHCLRNAKAKRAVRNQDKFRQKDVVRNRAAYWSAKQLSNQSTSQAKSLPSIVDETFLNESLNNNRSKSSIVKAIAEAVKHILQKLEYFNDAAKKEFFKRLWLHQIVKQFQPARFGCAKVDALVSP
jgi:hypothetical protein